MQGTVMQGEAEMQHRCRRPAAALLAAALILGPSLSACSRPGEIASSAQNEPAKVERVEGSQLPRLVLTARAVERVGITTQPVREIAGTSVTGSPVKIIPFSAVLFDNDGLTWAYTNPEPRTYVRQRVTLDRIDGDRALLRDGPPAGTPVVTVGAPELLGTEYGVGEE